MVKFKVRFVTKKLS
uniref:Uncharacterized protein n=1 Tax=Anguilla anguilla TaxID=7936 RepID=A0A0E9UQM2_ANGAN